VMRVEEVATPVPGPGQVLVAVRAAGVNPVDTYIRAGVHGYGAEVPYTPGSDAAGVVDRVGDGVTGVAPGDRVFTAGTVTGAYAELTLCAAGQVYRLPERADFAQGAALGIPCAAAYRALFQRGRARPGETVLVHGATGSVGLAAVQLARAAGLVVFGTGGDAAGCAAASESGAVRVFDHGAPDHLDHVLAATDGRGVDLIVEMLANRNLGRDLAVLAPRGRVVVVGSRGTVEVDPRALMVREAEVRGMLLGQAPEAERSEIYAALQGALEGGFLTPPIGAEFPLEAAPEAHRLVAGWQGGAKIVLVP
ncbi:MAG TPA: NADPH:quinone reductase, partial [Deferrisomatales bacterium]|nr:NADPH:quinone reductase [Deferrisomatales bacterium]